MKKRRTLLFISLLLCSLLVSCTGSKEGSEETIKSPGKGDKALEVVVRDLDGKTVKLSQFKGKVVMLNFWATWCPPCREEMPSMEALYKKFKGTDLVMLPVSIDDNADTIRDFMKRNRYAMPVYHDSTRDSGSAYGITGVPETFIIDKNGVISEKIIGPLDWISPDVVKVIQDLMK